MRIEGIIIDGIVNSMDIVMGIDLKSVTIDKSVWKFDYATWIGDLVRRNQKGNRAMGKHVKI